MRLSRLRLGPRLRLRTLLIAVAVAGLALGGWKRREYCLRRAVECDQAVAFYEFAKAETELIINVDWPDDSGPRPGTTGGRSRKRYEGSWLIDRKDADRNRELARRCRHVARYPWLPLPREPE